MVRDPDAAARIASNTKGCVDASEETETSGSNTMQGKWHSMEWNDVKRDSAEARLKDGLAWRSGVGSASVEDVGVESTLYMVALLSENPDPVSGEMRLSKKSA